MASASSCRRIIFLFQGRRGGTKHLVCTGDWFCCIKLKLSWRPGKDLFFCFVFIVVPVYFYSGTCVFLRQSFPRVIMSFWNETSIPVSFLQNSWLLLHHSPLPFPQGFYNIHRENVNSNSKTENTFFLMKHPVYHVLAGGVLCCLTGNNDMTSRERRSF